MAIKPCPKCGEKVSENAKFCENCGASILSEEELLRLDELEKEKIRLAEEKKEEENKKREEMLKTARSLTESISSDIGWWIPTTKKKVSTIIALLIIGASYYIQFALSSSSFNFISFLIIELLMLALYFPASDFIWGIIFSFIRTVKISNRLKKDVYGYNQGKPWDLAYLYKAFSALSLDTEFCNKNKYCIESINRAFIFLSDPKGKKLILVQFFVGFVLGLAELVFNVIFGVFAAAFVVVSIESGTDSFVNSFDLEELKNLLILLFFDAIVNIAFSIFKSITNRKLLERSAQLEFQYTTL